MKRLFLILSILITFSGNLFSQTPKEKFYEYYNLKDYNKASHYISSAIENNKKDLNLILNAGDTYFELDKLDSALILYKLADDIESDEPDVLRRIAKTYIAMKNFKKAFEAINDAIDEDNSDAKNWLCLGNIYLAADSLDKASIYFTKARELDKSLPEAYIALGDLYFAQRVYELSKDNYERALSLDESNLEARSKLAISYYWLAQREMDYDKDLANELFKKSLQEWNTITKQDTMNAKAFFEQGKILFYSKIWDEAAKSLYRYVKLRPDGYLGRWYLAQSLYELAQCDSAEEHLKISSQNIDSVKVKAKLLLARCYFDSKNYERCTGEYENLMTELDLNIEDLKKYAASVFQLGDTLKSLSINEKIISMDSSDCKTIFNSGLMYFILKNYNDAIRLLSLLENSKCNEYNKKGQFYLGLSFLFNDKPKLAILPLKKAYDIDSTNLNALIYLADSYSKISEIYISEKKLDSSNILKNNAIQEFNFVVEKAISDTTAQNKSLKIALQKLCGIYLNDKNSQKLRKTSKIWVDYFSDDPNGYLYLGASYQLENNSEEACKNYKLVLKYDKNNTFAKKMINQLECK